MMRRLFPTLLLLGAIAATIAVPLDDAWARTTIVGTAFGAGFLEATAVLDRLFALLAIGAFAAGSGAGDRAAPIAVGAALLGAAIAFLGIVIPRGGDASALAAVVAGLLALTRPRVSPAVATAVAAALGALIGYISGGSLGFWLGFLWGVFVAVAAGGGLSAIRPFGVARIDRAVGAAAAVVGVYDFVSRF